MVPRRSPERSRRPRSARCRSSNTSTTPPASRPRESLVPPPPGRPGTAGGDDHRGLRRRLAGVRQSHQLAEQIRATPGFQHLDTRRSPAPSRASSCASPPKASARVRSIAKAIGDDIEAREEAFALATLFVLFDGEVGDEGRVPGLLRRCTLSDGASSISIAPRPSRLTPWGGTPGLRTASRASLPRCAIAPLTRRVVALQQRP